MTDHAVAAGDITTGIQVTAANVVDKCVFADNQDYIEVITDGAFELWVRVDGVDPASPFPRSWRLPAGQPSARYIFIGGASPDVRLKSPGITTYSVTGIQV